MWGCNYPKKFGPRGPQGRDAIGLTGMVGPTGNVRGGQNGPLDMLVKLVMWVKLVM